MDPLFYYVLHVIGVILFVAYAFQAFAHPERGKRTTMMMSGIFALVVLVAGFGLKAKVPHVEGWPLWLIGKLGCWLLIALLPGVAYRNHALVGLLRMVTIALVALAVYLVYMKPTF